MERITHRLVMRKGWKKSKRKQHAELSSSVCVSRRHKLATAISLTIDQSLHPLGILTLHE